MHLGARSQYNVHFTCVVYPIYSYTIALLNFFLQFGTPFSDGNNHGFLLDENPTLPWLAWGYWTHNLPDARFHCLKCHCLCPRNHGTGFYKHSTFYTLWAWRWLIYQPCIYYISCSNIAINVTILTPKKRTITGLTSWLSDL